MVTNQGSSKFRTEKLFLISTLIFFSVSYLISTVRNIILYVMITDIKEGKSSKAYDFFCKSNLHMSMFNAATFILTELVPYTVIFWLNFRNFRTIEK